MRSWSLRLGRFFGIDVFVHWTFSILLVWIFLMHISGGHGAAGGIAGVFFVLALFACVVLHEFGHALTAARRTPRAELTHWRFALPLPVQFDLLA